MHEKPQRQLGLQVESLFPPGPQLQGWRNGFQRHRETVGGADVTYAIVPKDVFDRGEGFTAAGPSATPPLTLQTLSE